MAADKVSRLVLPASYRPGRRVDQHLQRVPEKLVHAVGTNTWASMCGKPVEGLHWFEHVNRHLRRPMCDATAGHPRRRRP